MNKLGRKPNPINPLRIRTWDKKIRAVASASKRYKADNDSSIANILEGQLNSSATSVVKIANDYISVHPSTISRLAKGSGSVDFNKTKNSKQAGRNRLYDLPALVEEIYPDTRRVLDSYIWPVLEALPYDKKRNDELKEKIFSDYKIREIEGLDAYRKGIKDGLIKIRESKSPYKSIREEEESIEKLLDKSLTLIERLIGDELEILAVLGMLYRESWHAMNRQGLNVFIRHISIYIDRLSEIDWLKGVSRELQDTYRSKVLNSDESYVFAMYSLGNSPSYGKYLTFSAYKRR